MNTSVSTSATAHKRPPLSKRWTFIILALTLLFVLMPFLFWRATWFGRTLTNAQLADYLNPKSNPHDIQHALSQVADRIVAHDSAITNFYPQVIALSSSPDAPIRAMDAWTMGQDNQAPQFHTALRAMLSDPDLTVRRNAALALVRFDDTSGHAIIVGMLKAAAVDSSADGTLQTRLKPNQTMNPGTLIARIHSPAGEREVRSEIPGTLNRWLVSDGASVTAGQHIAAVWPSDDEVWEALRALYLVGTPEDLEAIAPYARGGGDAPPQIAEQARSTMEAIRSRPAAANSNYAESYTDPNTAQLREIASNILGAMKSQNYQEILRYDLPELRAEHSRDLDNKTSDLYCYLIGNGCLSKTKYNSIHSQFAAMRNAGYTIKQMSKSECVLIFFDGKKYKESTVLRTSFLCRHANAGTPVWTFEWHENHWQALHSVFDSEADAFCSSV